MGLVGLTFKLLGIRIFETHQNTSPEKDVDPISNWEYKLYLRSDQFTSDL